MKSLKILSISLSAFFLMGGVALAIPAIGDLTIDFRDTPWSGAHGETSYTVGNVTANVIPLHLYQEGLTEGDGLGILEGVQFDEIDGNELLEVVIGGGGMYLTGVWVTNLYQYKNAEGTLPDGAGDPQGEHGRVSLNNGEQVFDFYGLGNRIYINNGEVFVDFGGPILVNTASFRVVPFGESLKDNDYSVAGFTAVPEPATVLLLGSGLIGIGVFVRRRFRK